MLFALTLRAHRAFGPADRRHGINADLLVAEVSDSLLECLWLFHNEAMLPEKPWLVKYIIAQNWAHPRTRPDLISS